MILIKKLLALLLRTFIAECPACYKHFYGFNKYKEQHKIGGKQYRIVCHRCSLR